QRTRSGEFQVYASSDRCLSQETRFNIQSLRYLGQDEKESRNIKKALSNELGDEIEPNTIENQNNDELLGEISDDEEESNNEQSENEEGKLTAPIELLGDIAVLIYEPENTEAKQFFPLFEEKKKHRKLLVGRVKMMKKQVMKADDSNTKSTSCSNSNDEENEESSDDSEEN
ncbi:PREDICTED: glutamate-rich protein 2, partial [Fulmarus glacialis]|uniref:glutamate-rich protein 2 n=1 Tax=Fulmarus glacialis TaxID=30455 RepID=UPI00051C8A72